MRWKTKKIWDSGIWKLIPFSEVYYCLLWTMDSKDWLGSLLSKFLDPKDRLRSTGFRLSAAAYLKQPINRLKFNLRRSWKPIFLFNIFFFISHASVWVSKTRTNLSTKWILSSRPTLETIFHKCTALCNAHYISFILWNIYKKVTFSEYQYCFKTHFIPDGTSRKGNRNRNKCKRKENQFFSRTFSITNIFKLTLTLTLQQKFTLFLIQ